MKQVYIVEENYPRLLVFFAGWACDETPFRHYRPQGTDYLVCYDYRTLDMDTDFVNRYDEIHVVGWSMGVWAASHVGSRLGGNVRTRVALNGTPFPIDERRGIPPAIYQGTLEGLCGASLHKFLRRMCADSAAFRAFLDITPRRPVEELREELASIAKQDASLPAPRWNWTEAVVGTDDRIIPPANQSAAWREAGTSVREVPCAHYHEPMFHHYLQARWTND